MSKCNYICARDLKHKVTIQSATVALDTFGQPTETWTTWGTAWASITQLTASGISGGREARYAQQVNGEITHEFRMRYRAGIVLAMRFSFDSRTFGIVDINNVNEEKVELRIMCKEVV